MKTLEVSPLIFVYLYMRLACDCRRIPVIANTHTKSIQKQVKSVDVVEVGSKKPLVSKFCFV